MEESSPENLVFSEDLSLSNETLLQFISDLTLSDQTKLDQFLNFLIDQKIEIKLSENEDFLLSESLSRLILDKNSEQAVKLSQFIAIASSSPVESYNIVSGVLNLRSEETVKDVVQIIQNFVTNGLNPLSKGESNKTIIEYAAEQFFYSMTRGSCKGTEIKKGDAVILKSMIQSVQTPVTKEEKIELYQQIDGAILNGIEFDFKKFIETISQIIPPRTENFYSESTPTAAAIENPPASKNNELDGISKELPNSEPLPSPTRPNGYLRRIDSTTSEDCHKTKNVTKYF